VKIVGGKWSNWSGGVVSKPKAIIAPKDEVELAQAVRQGIAPVRVPGTGHSFTPICATDGTLIDASAFNGVKGMDPHTQIATLGAATPLWEVGPQLCAMGYGLKNMGDIDRQTLGGVVGTGTHGTGITLKSFSGEVAGFRLVMADGLVIDCTPQENAELYEAGRLSLGMFGVMTEISMHVRPAYRLVEKNFLMPPKELFAQLDELVNTNRHFEFFWFPYADVCICKSLNETTDEAPAPRSAEAMYERGEKGSGDMAAFAAINHVLPYMPFLLRPAHRLFSQLMPGRGKARWSHELFPSPRTVRFNEMEYAVPYAKGPDCIREIVDTVRKKKINTGFPIEYRSVAADDVWLSPFYQRPSATIAVHQHHPVDTGKLFTACETIFRAYEGRPHWGKRHSRTAEEVETLYPQYGAFRALRRKLDPQGKFLNPHLAAIFA
jgi:FAD-linked oxidoreductase